MYDPAKREASKKRFYDKNPNYQKDWRDRNRGKHNQSTLSYYRAVEEGINGKSTRRDRQSVLRYLLSGAVGRSKKRGIPYSEVEELFEDIQSKGGIGDSCKCCKQVFTSKIRPSLDRHEPALGYTVGNVLVICRDCNRRKGDMGLRELEELVEYMKTAREELDPAWDI